MEKIFNNLLDIHHQIETNIIMMLETELNKKYKDINVDYCYRKIYIKDYDYFAKRVYIKNYEFKFKITDDYIYIEYIDTKCLLDYTPYKQTRSIKAIIGFIEDVIKKARSL